MKTVTSEHQLLSRAESRLAPPIFKYARFLPIPQSELINLGLNATPLIESPALAVWAGVRRLFLKIETTHPTGTFKDRVTEVMLSFFQSRNMVRYAHASTGNTATSLAWGVSKLGIPMHLQLFVAEPQLLYHHIPQLPNINVTLLRGSTYDEAKRYTSWFVKYKWNESESFGFDNPLRHHAHKISYLEAFEELHRSGTAIDIACQTISSGLGLIGASLAAHDAVREGWLDRLPRLLAAQPSAVNPIVRCFNSGSETYDHVFDIHHPRASRAWAIRLGNPAKCYRRIANTLKQHKGIASDAREREITAARDAVHTLAGIDAGHTACVSLAALKKVSFERKSRAAALVVITGRDRRESTLTQPHTIIEPSEWKRALAHDYQSHTS